MTTLEEIILNMYFMFMLFPKLVLEEILLL